MSILLSQLATVHRRSFFATLLPALGFFPKPVAHSPLISMAIEHEELVDKLNRTIDAWSNPEDEEEAEEQQRRINEVARSLAASNQAIVEAVLARRSSQQVPEVEWWYNSLKPLVTHREGDFLFVAKPNYDAEPPDHPEDMLKPNRVCVTVIRLAA